MGSFRVNIAILLISFAYLASTTDYNFDTATVLCSMDNGGSFFKVENQFGENQKCKYIQTYNVDFLSYSITGFTEVENLEIRHSPSSTLPEDIFIAQIKLNSIYIKLSDFSDFPKDVFKPLVSLKRLNFDQNDKLRIIKPWFRSLNKLTDLSFYYNPIEQIEENAFENLTSLENLNMDTLMLSTLPENIFKDLKNLKSLNIGVNQLTDLPKNIFKPLVNLKELELSYGGISNLRPEWFSTLEHLEVLGLWRIKIEKLPMNVFGNLKALQKLIIYDCKLKFIDSVSFGLHPNMKEIRVERNQIEAVDPKLIAKIPSISIYNFKSNICVNEYITDITTNKTVVKAKLNSCFNNFKDNYACQTLSTYYDEKIAELQNLLTEGSTKQANCEANATQLAESMKSLKEENDELYLEIEKMASIIKELEGQNSEYKKKDSCA